MTARGPAAVHNLEAEAAVLGCALLEPAAMDEVMDGLTVADFYRPQHQAVFDALRAQYDAGGPIDAVTVAERMRQLGSLDRTGGVGVIFELIDAVISTSNVGHYVGIVRGDGLRRRLARTAGEIGTMAAAVDRPIGEILDVAEQAILDVATAGVADRPQTLSPTLPEALESFDPANAATQGLATGYRDLDRLLGGVQPGNLVMLAARPSMGKSGLALSIAHRVAQRGEPVAVVSLEMTRLELVQRLVCQVGRVDSQRAKGGDLSPEEWQRLAAAANQLHEVPLFIDEPGRLTVTELRARARRIKREAGGLALLVVDYLQLMDAPGENRQQEISSISRGLKALARDLEVPLLAISQLNRGVEIREDKRPRLADLRESGSLEQDSDVVMFLYRDEYYHPDRTDDRGVAEVRIAKYRTGAVGSCRLMFNSTYAAFEDLAANQ